MADFVPFECFPAAAYNGKHNLASNSLKLLLTNTAPDAATDTVKTDITEISAGNGYTSGGLAVTVSSSAQSAGTYKLVIADITITASGGSIGPFRYGVLYNDTAASDDLIGYMDAGSAVTTLDGGTFTFDCDPATGIFQDALS